MMREFYNICLFYEKKKNRYLLFPTGYIDNGDILPLDCYSLVDDNISNEDLGKKIVQLFEIVKNYEQHGFKASVDITPMRILGYKTYSAMFKEIDNVYVFLYPIKNQYEIVKYEKGKKDFINSDKKITKRYDISVEPKTLGKTVLEQFQ